MTVPSTQSIEHFVKLEPIDDYDPATGRVDLNIINDPLGHTNITTPSNSHELLKPLSLKKCYVVLHRLTSAELTTNSQSHESPETRALKSSKPRLADVTNQDQSLKLICSTNPILNDSSIAEDVIVSKKRRRKSNVGLYSSDELPTKISKISLEQIPKCGDDASREEKQIGPLHRYFSSSVPSVDCPVKESASPPSRIAKTRKLNNKKISDYFAKHIGTRPDHPHARVSDNDCPTSILSVNEIKTETLANNDDLLRLKHGIHKDPIVWLINLRELQTFAPYVASEIDKFSQRKVISPLPVASREPPIPVVNNRTTNPPNVTSSPSISSRKSTRHTRNNSNGSPSKKLQSSKIIKFVTGTNACDSVSSHDSSPNTNQIFESRCDETTSLIPVAKTEIDPLELSCSVGDITSRSRSNHASSPIAENDSSTTRIFTKSEIPTFGDLVDHQTETDITIEDHKIEADATSLNQCDENDFDVGDSNSPICAESSEKLELDSVSQESSKSPEKQNTTLEKDENHLSVSSSTRAKKVSKQSPADAKVLETSKLSPQNKEKKGSDGSAKPSSKVKPRGFWTVQTTLDIVEPTDIDNENSSEGDQRPGRKLKKSSWFRDSAHIYPRSTDMDIAIAAEVSRTLFKITCLICDEEFNFVPRLRTHMQKHFAHGEPEECSVCGQKLNKKKCLDHYLNHCTPIVSCFKCGESFKYRYLLKNHIIAKHRAEMNADPWECNVCAVPFYSQESLFSHVLTHTEKELQTAYKLAKNKKLRLKKTKAIRTTLEIPSSPKPADIISEIPSSPKQKDKTLEIPSSPKPKDQTLDVPSSPKPKNKTLEIPSSPKPKDKTLEIPASPKPMDQTLEIPSSPKPKDKTLEIPSSRKSNEKILDADLVEDEEDEPERTPIVTRSVSKDSTLLQKNTTPMRSCSCHKNQQHEISTGIIMEIGLACEPCHILFKTMECFKTHQSDKCCSVDTTNKTAPKMFCSNCCVIFHSLQEMHAHLESHKQKQPKTKISFMCKLCHVVFFGMGSLFYTHWFNHCKDEGFRADYSSFPENMKVTILNVNTLNEKNSGQNLFIADYVCNICKTPFDSDRELRRHVHSSGKTCSGVKEKITIKERRSLPFKLICSICNHHFVEKSLFDEHCIAHETIGELLQEPEYDLDNERRRLTCKTCGTSLESETEFQEHSLKHKVILVKYVCIQCLVMFDALEDYETHLANHRINLKKMRACQVVFATCKYHCKKCRLFFDDQASLDEHISNHETVRTPMEAKRKESTPLSLAVAVDAGSMTENKEVVAGSVVTENKEVDAGSVVTEEKDVDATSVVTEESNKLDENNSMVAEKTPSNDGETLKTSFLRVKKLSELLETKRYECASCSLKFDTEMTLKKHVCRSSAPKVGDAVKTSGPMGLSCHICGNFETANDFELKLHVLVHFPLDAYPKINEGWYGAWQYHGCKNVFKCKICVNFETHSSALLQGHFLDVHSRIYNPMFKCRICRQFMANGPREIREHEQSHALMRPEMIQMNTSVIVGQPSGQQIIGPILSQPVHRYRFSPCVNFQWPTEQDLGTHRVVLQPSGIIQPGKGDVAALQQLYVPTSDDCQRLLQKHVASRGLLNGAQLKPVNEIGLQSLRDKINSKLSSPPRLAPRPTLPPLISCHDQSSRPINQSRTTFPCFCGACLIGFSNENQLLQHIQQVHPTTIIPQLNLGPNQSIQM